MVGFTPVEEVERILMVPRDMVEKEVRVFSREEWVEEAIDSMLMGDLVVVVVVLVVVVEAAEGTLVEAVEMMIRTPVGEGEDLITPEQIRTTNVVSTQLAMVM